MSDSANALARSMQGFGSALGNLGETIIKLDAKAEIDAAQTEIVQQTEQFKQDLLTDPNYGTPEVVSGTREGYLAKHDELLTKLRKRAEGIKNSLARQQVQSWLEETGARQETAVTQMQYEAWGKGTFAKEMTALRAFNDTTTLSPEERIQHTYDTLDGLRKYKVIDDAKATEILSTETQYIMRGYLVDRAKEAYQTGGLGAAIQAITDNHDSYVTPVGPVGASDTIKAQAKQDISEYHKIVQESENSRMETMWANSVDMVLGRGDSSKPVLTTKMITESSLDSGNREHWVDRLISLDNWWRSARKEKTEEEDIAETVIRRMAQQWEKGVGEQTGYGILATINEYENKGDLKSSAAHKLRGEIINTKFPAAKDAFDSMRMTSMAILGMKKEPTSDDDLIRLNQFNSTMSAYLTDKIMEYGGNVTPAVVADIMETARQVVTMKALDEVQERLFDQEGDPLLRAIKALDSKAGRTAVFTDVNFKTQFLKPGVETVYETRASMEVDYLGKLGIKTVSSSAEPEDVRGFDITGAKIHIGEDGKQYRLAESGGKIIVLTRSRSDENWKEREPSKAPPAPKEKPLAAAGDLTKVSGVDKYINQDISATWDKATKDIVGRDRMMLPTTKKAQIAWLIKQGFLNE